MKYFIKNKITAYMLFSGLFIFGAIGLTQLSVSLMPPTNFPAISIIIEYPGMSPQKIETIITKPIEKIIKTISGIEEVNSISEEGKSRINVSFQLQKNIKIASLEVREKIGLIRSRFPREVQEPVVVRYDPSDRPVLIATVNRQGMSLVDIREYVDRKIKPKLQRIDGISEILIAGGQVREIHIMVDRARMMARDLSFRDIAPIVQDNNISIPGGIIQSGDREFIVYTTCRYPSVDSISEAVVMKAPQGSLIRIKDFSDVANSFRDKEDISRLNGNERITIYIHKAGDANTVNVCTQALQVLQNESVVKTKVIYNQGTYVRDAIDNVIFSSIWGIIIVFIVLSLFMKKPSIVLTIGLSIPLSLVIAFAFMYFFKVSLNVMSMSGLALGVGMVVDNGIVISAAIHEKNPINSTSIVESVASMRNAIITSTMINITVFFPLVFGNVSTKKTYGDLAFTISAALFISLLTSIILIPTIFSELYGIPERMRTIAARLRRPLGNIPSIHAFLQRSDHWWLKLLERFDRSETKVHHRYLSLIDYTFANKKRMLTSLAFLLAVAVILSFFIKSEIIDPMAAREFYAYLEFPTGTTLNRTDEAVKMAERYIKKMGIAEDVSTKVEKWRGTLSIKFNDSITSESEQQRIKKQIKSKVGALLKPYRCFVFISEADEVAARELSITFTGNENELLQKLAKEASGKISTIKGIEDCVLRFREGKPEYALYVDREKASSSGLTPSDITDFFRSGVFGPVITKYIDVDHEVDVRMRFQDDQRDDIDKILNYSIKNAKGEFIPAKEIVNIKTQTGPTKIWRKDGRRCVTITAKIGSLSYDEAVNSIDRALKKVKFPEEYAYEYDENLKKMKENRNSMMLTIITAILLIYMILASLYESFRLPLVIMTTVPLAIIGVIISLFVTSTTISISVYIGMIILSGIVVNNGIILVNTIQTGFLDGKMTRDTINSYIKDMSHRRFRPVIMTASTTILGMVPMLLNTGDGSNLWRPLALTVISGLAFSTILTLVVIPTICTYHYTQQFKR